MKYDVNFLLLQNTGITNLRTINLSVDKVILNKSYTLNAIIEKSFHDILMW